MASMNLRIRKSTAFALLAALFFPASSTTQTVDDAFLMTTSVQPNVLLLIDNSYRMNNIEWHPAFDPDIASTCAAFSNTTTYTAGVGLIDEATETYCGNTRKIFTDAETSVTLYDGRYLNWYFSDAADPFYTEIQTAKATQIACNQAGGGKKFEELYRRTRNTAARHVILDVLCLSEPRGVKIGLATFREPGDAGDVDPNGGYMSIAPDRSQPTHAANMEAAIKITKDDDWAPVSEAVFQLYTYLMPHTATNCTSASPSTLTYCLPKGRDGVTNFPRYAFDKFGNSDTPGMLDPVTVSCQKNFIIVVTGGNSSRDDFDADPTSTSPGFTDFANLIGDYYSDGEVEVAGTATEETWYLDDIAKYMHDKDLRPDFDDDQTVDLYLVGFGTTSSYDGYLQRAADLGSGLFYHANEGEGLSAALVAALNDIVEKARSFTAATVPSSRTADGSDLYNSFFIPSSDKAFWEGHLRSWKFSATGEILDRDGHCALEDPDGGSQCNNGPFKKICQVGESWPACVNPYWDAGDATRTALTPGYTNLDTTSPRQLFTSKLSAGVPVRTDLDQNLTAVDMNIQTFAVPPWPAPESNEYNLKGSLATNEEGLADEIVMYARGCHFGTGALANVSTVTPCSPRPWFIGDIFHSDPIVVRAPPTRPLGTAYDSFRSNYLDRDRVIYTGTNGGFLEAFHAGTWNTGTQTYDQGTGVEKFGFMPWVPRKFVKHQTIDDPANRTHYVDGAPQVADAWLYSTATVATQVASDWRTILVGGLREGGRQYYALDVTNPSNDSPPGGGSPISYPGLQWEFPNENDFNSGTGDYVNMGQTWGQPVIARVKLNVGASTNSGAGFERWVAIVTGGYEESSDPNPTPVNPEAGVYAGASTKGRAIYVLDLKTGKVIAEQKLGTCSATVVAHPGTVPATINNTMCYAIPSTPTVLDIDGDGYADSVYVGDLSGQLWKWVIHNVGEDRANDGSGVRTQPNWKFQLFFQAPTKTISGTIYHKNIFQPPAAALVNGVLWLTFGTGERNAIAYLGNTGTTDENNRYYVINDPDPLASAASAPAIVTELPSSGTCPTGYVCTINDLTTTGTPGPRGYYFKTVNGEKFVTSSAIFAGKVITATFTPSDCTQAREDAGLCDFDPCTQRGSGNLYKFDLLTGVGDYRDASNNPQRYTSLGSGLPTDPKISIGVGGDDNKIVIQKSGTEIEILDTDDASYGRGIIYWRELR
jgi:type IV pilus assembly protein PilY1